MTDCDRVQRDIAAGKPGQIIMGCSEHGMKCIERKSAGATPDTKPAEGLGEAKPVSYWLAEYDGGQYFDVYGGALLGGPAGRFPRRDEAEKFVESVNSFDALTQRVKVLEEALGKIARYVEIGIAREGQRESLARISGIVEEALK